MSLGSTTAFALFGAWLLMLVGDWFFTWFILPDAVLLTWIALRFALDKAPLWPSLLGISLLLDVSAHVPLGFHALIYALCALLLLPGMAHLRLSSGLEQLFVIALVSFAATLLKGVMLYVMLGMAMPLGWPLGIFIQIMLWPFARALGEALMRPHIPRDQP